MEIFLVNFVPLSNQKEMEMICIKNGFIFFILGLSLFCACSTSSYIYMDVLNPAKQPLLQESAEIALVNDVFNPDKKDDCGQYYIFENEKNFDTTCRTRMLSQSLMEGIHTIIDDAQFFATFDPVLLAKKNTAFSDILLLPQADSADIILVLNSLKMKDETYFVPVTLGGYAVTMAQFTVVLTFYDIASQTLITSKSLTDTVYWVSGEISHYEFTNIQKERGEILQSLAFEAGKKISSTYFPSWKTVSRVILIAPDAASHHAAEAALSGSWERADYYWQAISKEKNKKKSSAAWFNRAINQEIEGNFEIACSYIKQAESIYNRKIHQDYLEILKERIEFQKQFDSLQGK